MAPKSCLSMASSFGKALLGRGQRRSWERRRPTAAKEILAVKPHRFAGHSLSKVARKPLERTVEPFALREQVFAVAAAAQEDSNHPLTAAIRRLPPPGLTAQRLTPLRTTVFQVVQRARGLGNAVPRSLDSAHKTPVPYHLGSHTSARQLVERCSTRMIKWQPSCSPFPHPGAAQITWAIVERLQPDRGASA
jgi:hypothetical protein